MVYLLGALLSLINFLALFGLYGYALDKKGGFPLINLLLIALTIAGSIALVLKSWRTKKHWGVTYYSFYSILSFLILGPAAVFALGWIVNSR